METKEYIEVAGDNISPVYEHVMGWVSDPHTYYQTIFIVIAIALSYGITTLIRSQITSIKEPDGRVEPFSKRWFCRRSGRLINPVLLLIFLLVGGEVFCHMAGRSEIVEVVQRLGVVWFFWVALRAFVTNPLIRTVSVWILLPAAALKLFGWFDSVVEYLNSYGFSLGDVEITAYTFVKAIFFVSVVLWLGKLTGNAGESYIRRSDTLTRPTKELLIKLFDIALYTVLFLTTLNLIGIDLTALAVFSGALGVGLGFGLQKIASNFISGIILLTEKSININNLIEMDDGVLGYVRKLGARASIVETFDGKEVMVPNEDFITSRVANLTHSSTNGRIEIPVGVSYDADLHLVQKLILKAANNYEKALKDDEDFEPKCFLREYGDSSVNFLLTFWLEDVTTGRWQAQSDVMFTIWDAFKEHDIEIPFPQRDLHIRSGLEEVKPKKATGKSKSKK